MNTRYIGLVLVAAAMTGLVLAGPCPGAPDDDEGDSSQYHRMPVNVSFFPGFSMGESMAKDKKILNIVALNILGGRAHRLNGAEIGTIWNQYHEDIVGLQVCGIANWVKGGGTGLQGAGIITMDFDQFSGGQIAGFGNVVVGDFRGLQVAGLVNLASDRLLTADWDEAYTPGTSNVRGIQYSGLANLVDGDFRGFQFSGMANAAVDVWGIQVAGLVNAAQTVHQGVQIAPFNVSVQNEGFPIGLVSYVKDVGLTYEAWADASRFINVGIHSGTRRFHNIFFTGIQVDNTFRWTLGGAVGAHITLSELAYLDTDIVLQHINEKGWTGQRNAVGRFRIYLGHWLRDDLSIYGGVSFNYLVSTLNDGSDVAPWSVYDDKKGGEWVRFWPGFLLGVRF
jgi:hypothetical protein